MSLDVQMFSPLVLIARTVCVENAMPPCDVLNLGVGFGQ